MLYPDFFIGKIQLYKQKMRKNLWTIDSRFFFFNNVYAFFQASNKKCQIQIKLCLFVPGTVSKNGKKQCNL